MFCMDLETSQLLRRLTEITEENNKILRKMQSHARWTMFFGTMKWLLFVGLAVGSFFVVQPYLDQTMKLYQTLESTQTQSQSLQDYLKNIGNSVKYTLPR